MKKLLVLLMLCSSLLASIGSGYNSAMKVYKGGDVAQAVSILEEAGIEGVIDGDEVEGVSNKKLASIINDYAFFLMKLDRSDEAKVALERVVQLDDQRAVAYYNLAEIADVKDDKHMARQYTLIYSYLIGGEKYLEDKNPNDLLEGKKLKEKMPKLLKKYITFQDLNNLHMKSISSYEVEQYGDYDYVAYVATKGKKPLTYFYGEGGRDDFWWFIFKMNSIELMEALDKAGYEFWDGDRVFEVEAEEYQLSYQVRNFISNIGKSSIEDLKYLIKADDSIYLIEEIKGLTDIYEVDDKGYDLLDYAYKYGSEEVITIVKGYYGNESFVDMVKLGEVEKVRGFIEDNKGIRNKLLAKDRKGRTAYSIIAEYNMIEMAKLYYKEITIKDLIAKQALADYYQEKDPIYLAVENRSHEVLELLFENNEESLGSLIDSVNYYSGENSLSLAIGMGDLKSVKLLVENGADIENANKNGETAILIAARLGEADIVEYLIEKGANKSIRDNKNKGLHTYGVYSKGKISNNSIDEVMVEAKKIYNMSNGIEALNYIEAKEVDEILDEAYELHNEKLALYYLDYGSYLVEAEKMEKAKKVLRAGEGLRIYDAYYYLDLAMKYEELNSEEDIKRALKKYLMLREDRDEIGSVSYRVKTMVKEEIVHRYLEDYVIGEFIGGIFEHYNLDNGNDYELAKLIIDYNLQETHFVLSYQEGGATLEEFVLAYDKEDLTEYYYSVRDREGK